MERFDAVIVGAGPAGSALAIQLARAGRSCLLVDGARFPRAKVCGEGLMPAGAQVLAELGLGPLVGERGQPFYGIRYRLPDGTCAEGEFPGGQHGWGISRRTLDAALVEAATAEPNVSVRLGTWIRELRLPTRSSGGARSDEVQVIVDDAPVRSPVLIGADGIRSTVRRAAGLEAPAPRRARFGVGAHFAHAPRDEARPLVEVFVGAGHELYTTPIAPDVTCAALLVEEPALTRLQGRLEEGLRELLAAAGGRCALLAESPTLARTRALGPLALQAKAAHGERVLLLGDAAGAIDPITGEGLSLALVTSQLAAEVLEGCYARGDFSARALAPWTRRRRAEARTLAGLTRVLLHLAERPQRAARVIRELSRSPQTFTRLLGIAAGLAPLRSLTVRDGLRLAMAV